MNEIFNEKLTGTDPERGGGIETKDCGKLYNKNLETDMLKILNSLDKIVGKKFENGRFSRINIK